MEKPRQHPRVASPAEVLVHSGEIQLHCRARDLSMAGCFVETLRAVESDTVSLVFVVPAGGEAVTCDARIVRRERGGLAVRFLGLDWGALFGLARLVSPGLA